MSTFYPELNKMASQCASISRFLLIFAYWTKSGFGLLFFFKLPTVVVRNKLSLLLLNGKVSFFHYSHAGLCSQEKAYMASKYALSIQGGGSLQL